MPFPTEITFLWPVAAAPQPLQTAAPVAPPVEWGTVAAEAVPHDDVWWDVVAPAEAAAAAMRAAESLPGLVCEVRQAKAACEEATKVAVETAQRATMAEAEAKREPTKDRAANARYWAGRASRAALAAADAHYCVAEAVAAEAHARWHAA